MVRWCYDPKTFRLVRRRAERSGSVLRDTVHAYDLVGNIVGTIERSPKCGIQSDELDREFDYDALYRLTRATGREANVTLPKLWDPAPRPVDHTSTRPYTETYRFDRAGNLTRLRHEWDNSPNLAWVRVLTPGDDSNRLASLQVGQGEIAYTHDPAGNMLAETTSRHMAWDYANRMKSFTTRAGSEPSVSAQYLYGADGMRVKKFVRLQGQSRSTTYLGGFEVHRDGPETNDEISVGAARIVVGRPFAGDPRRNDAWQATWALADQVGSVTVSTNSDGEWTNVEEYTPFGETSFGGYALKQYRFNGKERDEESGFAYYGLRYAAPWLGRWTCTDPLGPVDGPNLYQFTRSNPICRVDPTGGKDEPPEIGGGELPKFAQNLSLVGNLRSPLEDGPSETPASRPVSSARNATYYESTIGPRKLGYLERLSRDLGNAVHELLALPFRLHEQLPGIGTMTAVALSPLLVAAAGFLGTGQNASIVADSSQPEGKRWHATGDIAIAGILTWAGASNGATADDVARAADDFAQAADDVAKAPRPLAKEDLSQGGEFLNDLPYSFPVETPIPRPDGVPLDWVVKPSKNNSGGTRFIDPANPHNSVRVMPGDPKSPFPNSQGPYVRHLRNGQSLDVNGNVVSKYTPDAHIPVGDWKWPF